MKFFIVGIAVVACLASVQGALTPENDKLFKDKKTECMTKTEIQQKVIDEAVTAPDAAPEIFKQYVICLSKAINIADASGALQVDKILELLGVAEADKAQLKTQLEACAAKKEPTGFAVSICAWSTVKALMPSL